MTADARTRPFGEGLPGAIFKLTADADGTTYRAAYVVDFPEVVYVLDVFQKKSKSGNKTPKRDRARVKRRFQWAKQHYAEKVQRCAESSAVVVRNAKASKRRRGEE